MYHSLLISKYENHFLQLHCVPADNCHASFEKFNRKKQRYFAYAAIKLESLSAISLPNDFLALLSLLLSLGLFLA